MNENLIDRVIDWGCSCDMMNGYDCGHSEIRRLLEEALPEPTESDWDADRGDGFNSRGYDAGLRIYHDPMG